MKSKRTQRKWTWILSGFVVVALTGCGMYPKHPGDWPKNIWGEILHRVSDVIDFFAHHLGDSYGLAILIVTILVRLIVLPLFIRQIRYQRMMMELQPEMKKIRSKYKGDNQKIQQETMKLYQEAGTNPAAGCLPTIIQLPVLYALYGAIIGNAGMHQSTFLSIFPLGKHDPHYILPVIAGLTTFLSSWLTMKNQPSQQRAILFVMPLFIIFIGARLPSGLVLYWIYTNLFTALQTYWFLSRPMAAAKALGGAGTATVNVTAKPTSNRSGTTGAKASVSSKNGVRTTSGNVRNTKSGQGAKKGTPSTRPDGATDVKKPTEKKRVKPSNNDPKPPVSTDVTTSDNSVETMEDRKDD